MGIMNLRGADRIDFRTPVTGEANRALMATEDMNKLRDIDCGRLEGIRPNIEAMLRRILDSVNQATKAKI